MINDYDKGGLKMLDIKTFNRSLKSIWIKKYLDNENTGKWKLYFTFNSQNTAAKESSQVI